MCENEKGIKKSVVIKFIVFIKEDYTYVTLLEQGIAFQPCLNIWN